MYNHNLIEKKWQKKWAESKIFSFDVNSSKPKYFALNEFPYPSGAALHTGHALGWSFIDIHARFKRSLGFNVFCPCGWDSFGLPAEQFAIKNNKDPNIFTQHNIDTMREQIKQFGGIIDWTKEIDATNPKYYAGTQWIFAQLMKHNLAQLKEVEVNWCEQLQTVLANDEIIIKDNKMYSERGEYPVIKKPLKQWILKITDYAKKLSESLDEKTWPSAIIQKQWIGVNEGTLVTFKTDKKNLKLTVFTTRIDTIFGVTFLSIAPENKLVLKLINKKTEKEVKKYIEITNSKTELERKENKTKTGVFTGSYAINPFSNKKIPIYVADYVLNNYATGIVMGVPSCDQRDYEFAQKFNLPIINIIESSKKENLVNIEDGKHINSKFLNSLNIKEAKKKAIEFGVSKKIVKIYTTTKLHDWTFSRQRYWGEPFPIIYDSKKKPQIVNLDSLPIELPKFQDYNFEKKGFYSNPLDNAEDWKKVVIKNKKYIRETNTMPGSAASSWYFLAYILKNSDGTYEKIDSKEGRKRLEKWLPVDIYFGGKEHTTGHVLYARFWFKFLQEAGFISKKFKDFFSLRADHGTILAHDGRKMSKRWGNVVNPSEIINTHGADALRTGIAFMGPYNNTFPWSSNTIDGVRKWLDRIYLLFTNNGAIKIRIIKDINEINKDFIETYNVFISNAKIHLEEKKHNIVVSDMMIFINECYKNTLICKEHVKGFLTILSFFAPHVAEEINEIVFKDNTFLYNSDFPKINEVKNENKIINLPIQINGKLRIVIEINKNMTKQEIIDFLMKDSLFTKYLINNSYKNVIYVPNKIMNFII